MKPIDSLLGKGRPIKKSDVKKYALCYAYKQTQGIDITQDPIKIANYNKCDKTNHETDQECIFRLQGMLQKFSDMDQNLLDRDDEDRNEYQNRLRTMVVLTRQKSDFYSNLFERCDKEEKMD